MVAYVRRRNSPSLEQYLNECRNIRSEVAEAAELTSLLSGVGEDVKRVVDVGCGHGLTSFLLSVLREPVLAPVWIDADTSCRAARFAASLSVPFRKGLADVEQQGGPALVIAVNVCGQSLLDTVAWYRGFLQARALLCVPCCGIGTYEEWLETVQQAIGASEVRRVALIHNLKRTALLHTKTF